MNNPGSQEAIDKGCTCPILDNGRGAGVYRDDKTNEPVFWINGDCPLHGICQIDGSERREVGAVRA